MKSLPSPSPSLWAPRCRIWLMRWLARMDRRKARQLAASNLTVLDVQWKARLHRVVGWRRLGHRRGPS